MTVPPPSEDEMAKLFSNLSQSGKKTATLSIVTGFADMYKVDDKILSKPFSCLYRESCLRMSYTELLKECESAFDSISISEEQAVNIEVASRDQSITKAWF